MREYEVQSRDEIISFAKRAEISVDKICGANQGDLSDMFNLIDSNSKESEQAGISPEDGYSQLYWSCGCLYEVEAKGDEAPGFEASIMQSCFAVKNAAKRTVDS